MLVLKKELPPSRKFSLEQLGHMPIIRIIMNIPVI